MTSLLNLQMLFLANSLQNKARLHFIALFSQRFINIVKRHIHRYHLWFIYSATKSVQ